MQQNQLIKSLMILVLEEERKALSAVAEYGLHVYYNIPSLVDKVPLSPAGNPWTLVENAGSVYEYKKGTRQRSDALFARSILIPIPSKLTRAQEETAVEVIKTSVED